MRTLWTRVREIGLKSVLLTVGTHASSLADSPNLRPWTPTDSVAVTYYSPNPESPADLVLAPRQRKQIRESGVAPEVTESPDKAMFFVIRHRGDLQTDSNVYELLVFEFAALKRALQRSGASAPKPFRNLRLRSSSSEFAAIEKARWTSDSREIAFLGAAADGSMQVFRFHVKDDRLEQLTAHARRIVSFDYESGGLLFEDQGDINDVMLRYPIEPYVQASNGSVVSLLSRVEGTAYSWGVDRSAQPKELPALLSGKWISPNGRHAIITERRTSARHRAVTYLLQIETGITRPIDATSSNTIPVSLRGAFWSHDSTCVLLVRLVKLQNDPGAADTNVLMVSTHSIGTGEARILELIPLEKGKVIPSPSWRIVGQEVFFSVPVGRESEDPRVFAYDRDEWIKRPVLNYRAATRSQRVRVHVAQSANDPPLLVAQMGARTLPLTSPDPALEGIRRARTESFEWGEPEGETASGGLTLPPDWRGHRLPLVIQPYSYAQELFLPDGQNSTSDAAQSLAARGFAVLQIETPLVSAKTFPVKREGYLFIERVDAAVDELVRRGIVDATRVGIVGFSRSGYLALFYATHPGRIKLAAIVCADSFTGSYSSYLTLGAAGSTQFNYPTPGPSFWSDKAGWLEYETTFNADKISAPILFSLNGNAGGLKPYLGFDLQTMGAMRLNNKPFEYLYVGTGRHNLLRPLERIAMMDAVIDWMSFWIQGYEDPSPHKSQQYRRWRLLRDQVSSPSTSGDPSNPQLR
jgi:dipeptidyl aminopeptidase/acylaminoacyl peptidase